VLTFLQAQGVPKLIGKNDHPCFLEQEVSIYEEEELSKLPTVCSPYHSTLYDFLLMCGFREQEAMHVVWNNVRFNANIIEMRWKPQFNWTPKGNRPCHAMSSARQASSAGIASPIDQRKRLPTPS
jgi:integrase/recombinase XerD